MKTLHMTTLAAAAGLMLVVGAAAPQEADAQVRLQLGNQGDYWNRYWNWYDGNYRPYYTQRYRTYDDASRYRDGRFDDDYARRRYGDRYGDRWDRGRGWDRGRDWDRDNRYRDPRYGRFDDDRVYRGYRGNRGYRQGGGVDLGPLQLRWR